MELYYGFFRPKALPVKWILSQVLTVVRFKSLDLNLEYADFLPIQFLQ